MNDLAEKALRGLDVARRQVVTHPATSLAVGGVIVGGFVVVVGGAVAAIQPTRSVSAWLGLLEDHGLTGATPGALLLTGIVVLVALWLLTLEVVRRTAMPESRVWLVVAAFGAPFAVGPPLMDTAAYGYAAFGFLQRVGRSPYTDTPSSLGDNYGAAGLVDPSARGVTSAVGPLGSVLQHLAVSIGGGTPLGAVIVLRIVGVAAAVAIARFATDLAADPDTTERATRPIAIVLCGLNPLVLLYVVSSPHLDGPMLAFVLAALVAVRRRRWLPAVGLAAVAGSIGPQALIVVPIVVVAHVLGRKGRSLPRVLLRDGLAAAVVVVAAGLVQPGGFGWIGTVSDQFSTHTPYAVSYAVGRVLAPIVAGASFDDLAAAGRITAATAAFCVITYLVLSARHRPVEHTTGFALLAMALLSPNLYPWYLLWGLLCLAPTATGDRRIAVLALTAAGCVLVPPGFGDTTATVISAAGLVLIGVPLAVLALHRRRTAVSAAA